MTFVELPIGAVFCFYGLTNAEYIKTDEYTVAKLNYKEGVPYFHYISAARALDKPVEDYIYDGMHVSSKHVPLDLRRVGDLFYVENHNYNEWVGIDLADSKTANPPTLSELAKEINDKAMKKYKIPCNCTTVQLMQVGCRCGGL